MDTLIQANTPTHADVCKQADINASINTLKTNTFTFK